jgi:hypothetical protein
LILQNALLAIENIFGNNPNKSFWKICADYQPMIRREIEAIILNSRSEAERGERKEKGVLEVWYYPVSI